MTTMKNMKNMKNVTNPLRNVASGCRLVAAIALLSGGMPVFGREPTMIMSPTGHELPGLSQTESAVITRTNAARARSGLSPLSADGQLMNGARTQARWMAGNRSLTHGRGVAENIGMGQTSASEAVSSWMNSSGHRANILDRSYTRIGVAMAYGPDGQAYWCQQFR
ncbi:MAG: CAP domain-containing protein [Planctomycetota bacterium]